MKALLRNIRHSLSRKVIFGLLVMAIPVFLVSLGIIFVSSRSHIKDEAVEHAISALENTGLKVERHLGTVETAVNSNEWLVADDLRPQALLDLSRRIVSLNGNLDGCSISMELNTVPQFPGYFSAYTVRQGDSLVTVREDTYRYYEKTWYLEPLKQDSAVWVDPFLDSDEGPVVIPEMIVSYNKPVKNQQGKNIGVISSDLSLSKLAEVINSEHPYPNSYFIMLGKDGHYFVHPDDERLVSKTIFDMADASEHPAVTALGHEMTARHRGAMRVVIYGQPCLVCYQPVEGTLWSLALVCPEDDILRAYNRLALILAPLVILGLLLILPLCNHIVTYMVRPLNVLLSQVKRIAAGEYDETISRTRRRDAVGELQNSFALMQESLKERMSKIKDMNEETALRNEELKVANQKAEESARQKTAFIQNMTHQVRTPLNIIMGFAQVMRDSICLLSEDEMKSITTTMYSNAIKLDRMMKMLYGSSEKGSSEDTKNMTCEAVPVNEAARESFMTTQLFFPDLKVDMQTDVEESFTINTNRPNLVRSLHELLFNSAKYADDDTVTMHIKKTNGKVQFVLEDIGPGISEEYRDQMFKPFTKINDLSEGLGLGLPLTMRHAIDLGGSLHYDATYTSGCRFILEIPIA